jgi:hypothetical protein
MNMMWFLLAALASFGTGDFWASAGTPPSRRDPQPSSVTVPAVDSQTPSTTGAGGTKPSGDTGASAAGDKHKKKQSPEPRLGKSKRRKSIGKKARSQPKALVKPNLSYYGLLEQPQRYHPIPGRRRGEVPIPQVDALLHDHFQELDKNRDGTIDPLERAMGRLDIDRDLTTRQWH